MLVLSRHINERIIIGAGLVTITVIGFSRGQVRLGFEAPKELTIYREEVQALIDEEREKPGA